VKQHYGPVTIAQPGCFYIDGRWTAPRNPRPYPVIDPSTEEVHNGFVVGFVDDARAAITAARRAFDEGPWPMMDAKERARMVSALADALEARRAELEEAWTMQTGALHMMRPRAVNNGIRHFRIAAELGRTFAFEHPEQSVVGDALIRHEPVGVVAAIAAWNGPLLQLASKVGPALVAGCTVVMKPAPTTPIEAIIIAECAEAVGIPPGVLNLVILDADESELLVSDTRVDKVAFTGSTAVGRQIARTCADRIARYTLELGGKSAAIVLDDADITTVGKTMGRTITALSGQLCSMLSRVVVTENRHDALAEAIAAEMATVKIGDAHDPNSQMGPLASKRQLETVQSFVDKGKRDGAKLVYGGGRPTHLNRGFFHDPTLFANVSPNAAIAQEEIFGPVLSLIKAKDEEDAVRIANNSIYGLHGSVFTPDKARARAVAKRIRTGSFAQNGMKLDFGLPFGGYKQSGTGREGGSEAMTPYLETKTIILDA
jgi:aldehyde dehydrogenase (NAD+)